MTKFGIDIILNTKVIMKIGDDEVIADPEFFIHVKNLRYATVCQNRRNR